MTILQVLTTETVENSFLQYGVVGILALALGYFAWNQYNRLVSKNDAVIALRILSYTLGFFS